MSTLARRVGLAIRRRALLESGDRVVIALSGGSDSVALTFLLHDLAAGADWSVAGLIHVHHGLRGAEADADEAFCRALAMRLGLPVDVTHVDVRARARTARQSVELAARNARDEVFSLAARRLGATAVATGHTMDDQAETVLLRLLRGATARGVSAIRSRRGLCVRPVLDCRRDELRRYLARRAESFRDDASNADVSITRNRLRHQLMPVIQALAPGGVRALSRFARFSAEDERFLTDVAQAHGAHLRRHRSDDDGVQLERSQLSALPGAIARRIVREAIESTGSAVSSRHIDAVLRLAAGPRAEGRLDLSGLTVQVRPSVVSLVTPPDRSGGTIGFEHVLPVPGAVEISETRARVEASYREVGVEDLGGGAVAMLQASALTLPLRVRSRRPGDRLRPLGGPGSRKLHDLLVDRKIPRESRDALPIVTDADGRLVWVAGVAIADHCRVTAPEAGVVVLEFKALEKGY